MPLPKLKYSREQLEEIRGWVATNNWKLPKPQVAPSTQIRAEDLESTLLKGGSSSTTKDRPRDDRKPVDRRDERDHRSAGGHDDWGPRGRNRNREAFEEGYDYELQMKAQNRNDLQEALKAEEVRVAQKKRKDDEERRQREEIEQEEKAIQQQEEQGKIYEAQQMFGVAGVDERDTVWGAPAAKKHSRFAFQDVEEEEKKPRDQPAPASADVLDPFEGVKVSSAVHLPPQPIATQGAVITGVPPAKTAPTPSTTAAPASSSREPAAASKGPTSHPAAPSAAGAGKAHGQESGRQRRDEKHQPSASGNRQNQQTNSHAKGSHAQSQSHSSHSHAQPAATAAPQPAFVDPCIVSMSTDSAAKGTRAEAASAPSTSATTAPAKPPAAAGKSEPNSASVSALFAKLNIGGASAATPSGGSALHGAVDASQLESQLLAKQQPLQVQAVAANQSSSQPTYASRPSPAVAPQPVAPTSPPQKSAPPPPYQAQPQTTNPNTPPMMPMTVGGQQIHVAGHPGFLMMPQGYPLRPGQLYYPQQYFQMPPPPPQGTQGQGRSY